MIPLFCPRAFLYLLCPLTGARKRACFTKNSKLLITKHPCMHIFVLLSALLLLLCLGAPTKKPTAAPTRAPTRTPTRAPTPAPTTAVCPCANTDGCPQFVAQFVMTSPSITNGGVAGTLIYDYARQVLAFNYTGQAFQEIYSFNARAGYTDQQDQYVYRITAAGACQPCGSYSNRWGFPVTWAGCGVCTLQDPVAVGPVVNGCQNYTVRNGAQGTNWLDYFGRNVATGALCYLSNQQRLFTLSNQQCGAAYSLSATQAPPTCKCIAPIDIAFSLDRSTSISTADTYLYSQFIQSFLAQFYFNPSDAVHSTQMAIVQWGTTGAFPYAQFGNINFTMDPVNLGLTARNIGCTRAGDCNFCSGNGNSSACVSNSYTCTGCGVRDIEALYGYSTYIRRANAVQLAIVITDGVANTLYPGGAQRCCGLGLDQGIPIGQQGCTGPWQTTSPKGCYYDAQQQQQLVRAQLPALQIMAVGVGDGVDTTTLQTIATDPKLVYQARDWSALIANIQKIIALACPEPPPQGLCGAAACGFCACGTPQLPDVPLAPNLCSAKALRQQGACYNLIDVAPPCVSSPPPCRVGACVATLNGGAGGCDYTQVQACPPVSGSCYVNTCFESDGFCSLGACNVSKPGCCTTLAPTPAPSTAPSRAPTSSPTRAPSRAPTSAPSRAPSPAPSQAPTLAGATNAPSQAPTEEPTEAPTAEPTAEPSEAPTEEPTQAPTEAPTPAPCDAATHGQGCGANGACDAPTGLCVCANGFGGVLCNLPPNTHLCEVDGDCDDFNACTLDVCNASYKCQRTALVCDDNDACTQDACVPATGCVYVDQASRCDDNDPCTSGDACVPATGQCTSVNVSCAALETACLYAFCYQGAASPSELCRTGPVACARPDNCTVVQCVTDEAVSNSTNYTGCVNTTLNCAQSFIGVVVGVVAGVIAGSTLAAACLVFGAAIGGSAYAVSQNHASASDANVRDNPLYTQAGKCADVNLS